jgi:hypothetical protein
MRLGGAMHYKDWYRCLIWSTLVFLSLFIVAHAGTILSIIMTIFCAYILTGKGNINDTFLWKGKDTKYEDIVEFIKDMFKYKEDVPMPDEPYSYNYITYCIEDYAKKYGIELTKYKKRVKTLTVSTEFLIKLLEENERMKKQLYL